MKFSHQINLNKLMISQQQWSWSIWGRGVGIAEAMPKWKKPVNKNVAASFSFFFFITFFGLKSVLGCGEKESIESHRIWGLGRVGSNSHHDDLDWSETTRAHMNLPDLHMLSSGKGYNSRWFEPFSDNQAWIESIRAPNCNRRATVGGCGGWGGKDVLREINPDMRPQKHTHSVVIYCTRW